MRSFWVFIVLLSLAPVCLAGDEGHRAPGSSEPYSIARNAPSVLRNLAVWTDSAAVTGISTIGGLDPLAWTTVSGNGTWKHQATRQVTWFRLVVHNDGPTESLRYWLPTMLNADGMVYVVRQGHAVDSMHFDQRRDRISQTHQIKLRTPVGGRDTIYTRVLPCPRGYTPAFIFADALDMERDSRNWNYWQGLFGGMVALLMLYNLLLYYSLRDRVFLSFVLFLAGLFVFYAAIGYRAIDLVSTGLPLTASEWMSIGMACVLWGSFAVMRDFLHTPVQTPRVHALMRWLAIGATASQSVMLLLDTPAYMVANGVADVFLLGYILCAAWVHVHQALKGRQEAKLFLLANSPYLVAVAVQTVVMLRPEVGLGQRASANLTQGAMVVQAILFSFVVGRRISSVRRGKEMAEAEMQQRAAQHDREVAQLELQALRSQMNPHFIFNALNSINAFVQQNDPELASSFLTKFARLMRLVLENSRYAEVPLRSDLEALGLYLQLERVRSGDRFDYRIQVADHLDQDMVLVPPLVAQPFVENAIVHGMAGRADQGMITVVISAQGERLLIAVEDDGRGRKAAGEAKRTPGLDDPALLKKTSLGTAITSARLDLVGKQKGRPAGFEYVDLEKGTRVELTLPLTTND